MQSIKEKLNIGVGLAMVVLLIPSLFAFSNHSDNKHEVASQAAVKTPSTQAAKLTDDSYSAVPLRPVAAVTLTTYKDKSLTQKSGTIAARTQLNISDIESKSFKLDNGNYIPANKSQVISDVLVSKENSKQEVYTTSKANVYYNPYTTFDNQVYTTLPANTTYQADKVAKTHWGTYYEVTFNGGQTGWISAENISSENPKMIALQQLLNKKYNNKNYSIYVKMLDSDFTVGVNQKEQMYSASLSKLPILYWTQKRLNAGQANLTDQLYYSSVINKFPGAYNPAGTGILPEMADGKNYSLLDVINDTAKYSDNVGSNLLAYYETNQFSKVFQDEITKIAGTPWNPSERGASAEMVGRVLAALYNEGGAGFNALFNTNFDNIKIKAGVPSNIAVAHKIGDADSYNHDAAIVFASEPYILVVETDGGSDAQISQISKDVYGALS